MTEAAEEQERKRDKAPTVAELETALEAATDEAEQSRVKLEAHKDLVDHKPELKQAVEEIKQSLGEMLKVEKVGLGFSVIMTRDAAQEFLDKFETFRTEDQLVILNYLTKVTDAVVAFIRKYEAELALMAAHRERELKTLQLVDDVLANYR